MKASLAILLFYTLLLPTAQLQAQCEYDLNEVDAFTKDRKVTTSAKVNLSSTERLHLRFRNVDGRYLLSARVSNMYQGGVMGPETPLMLMLDNDSIVTLYPKEMVVAHPLPSGGARPVWEFEPTYAADSTDFLLLSMKPVKRIRIYTTDMYYEFDIASKKPNRERVLQAARCLLQALK